MRSISALVFTHSTASWSWGCETTSMTRSPAFSCSCVGGRVLETVTSRAIDLSECGQAWTSGHRTNSQGIAFRSDPESVAEAGEVFCRRGSSFVSARSSRARMLSISSTPSGGSRAARARLWSERAECRSPARLLAVEYQVNTDRPTRHQAAPNCCGIACHPRSKPLNLRAKVGRRQPHARAIFLGLGLLDLYDGGSLMAAGTSGRTPTD